MESVGGENKHQALVGYVGDKPITVMVAHFNVCYELKILLLKGNNKKSNT